MKKIILISIILSSNISISLAQNIVLLTRTEKLQLTEQGKEITYYRVLYEKPLKIKIKGPADLSVVIRAVSTNQLEVPATTNLIINDLKTGKKYSYTIQPKEVELNNFTNRIDIYPTSPVVLTLKIPEGVQEYEFSTTQKNSLGFAIRFVYKPKIISQKPAVKKEEAPPVLPKKEEKFDKFKPSVDFSTGVNFERYAGRSGQFFRLAGKIQYYFVPLLSIDVNIGGDFYKQNYFNYDANNSLLIVDDYYENRLLTTLFLSIHPDLDHKKIDLAPKIGINGAFVFSKDNSFNILGASAGIGVNFVFGKSAFSIDGDYTYNLLREKPDNILLVAPDGEIKYNGIFSIALNKQIRLRTGYSGESVIFPQVTLINQGNPGELKRVTRYYHGWLLGLEF